MSDAQTGLLLIVAGAIIWLFSRKKKTPDEWMMIEVVEWAPERRKSPMLVNILLIAGIVFFIWMNR
jgi:hypothetical protein